VAYLFATPDQQQEMLRKIGVDSIDALFDGQVPREVRLNRPLNLPPPLTELELERHLRGLAAQNRPVSSRVSFPGGGACDHFVPAAVDAIASRSEFYTAYTPYQAEASQGTLQAFFEYQTLITQLTGMEVSNASLYEGASAVSEAVIMAIRATDRAGRVVMLGSVHLQSRAVVQTVLSRVGCEFVTVPTPDGAADPGAVRAALNDNTACLVMQQPNFYGCLESCAELVEAAHQAGALAIVSFDPISLGLLPRPGDYGADIAVAEGQPLGIPLQYGGPYLGILTCRKELVRRMPGRLIGETVDRHGDRCFVLNLQAREQHIRREKATSNICTNQGLLALRATVYLALMGPQGLREAAELCCRKAHYAAERLSRRPGTSLRFSRPFFKEFVLESETPWDARIARAQQAGFELGPDLATVGERGLLVAVTEQRTREEIDRLAEVL